MALTVMIVKRILLLLRVILMSLWTATLVSPSSFTHFTSSGNGSGCPKDAVVLNMVLRSGIICALKCQYRRDCKTFDYNEKTKYCIGCRSSCGTSRSPTGSSEGQCWNMRNKQEYGSDCRDILENFNGTTDGVYSIKTDFGNVYDVFCLNYQIPIRLLGWTVFIRRLSEIGETFNRTFLEYKNGFGDVHGNHWRGLEFIYEMTTNTKTDLLILIEEKFHISEYAVRHGEEIYSNFKVGPAPNYTLVVDHLSSASKGTKKTCFSNSNHSGFSTKDRDLSGERCSQKGGYGGWWWNMDCLSFNPTGTFTKPEDDICTNYHNINKLTMAIRRRSKHL